MTALTTVAAGLIGGGIYLAGLTLVLSLCYAAKTGDRNLNIQETPMPYPPVQHPPCRTPYLDALCVLGVAFTVALVAAFAHRTGWLIGAGIVFTVALVRVGWLEQH